jgi:hypothetical protein
VFDEMNRTNLTTYRPDLFGIGKVFSDDFTYHPLGSIGANPFVRITELAELELESNHGHRFEPLGIEQR